MMSKMHKVTGSLFYSLVKFIVIIHVIKPVHDLLGGPSHTDTHTEVVDNRQLGNLECYLNISRYIVKRL